MTNLNEPLIPARQPVAEKCGPSVFADASRDMKALLEGDTEMNTARHTLTDVSTFGAGGIPVRRLGRIDNPITLSTNEGEVKSADTVALPALDKEYGGALGETIRAYQTKLNEQPSPVILFNPPRDMNDHHAES